MQGMRILWTLFASLLFGLSAGAQGNPGGKVTAELFHRVDGDTVEAVVEFELADHWHVYHTELGHAQAVGMPTTLTFAGEGVTWAEPVFPEPKRYDQSTFGPGVFILGHEGAFVVRATGTVAEGVTVGDVSVELRGQVCDPNVCLPFRFTVESQGEGDDALFASAEAGDEPEPQAEAEPVPTEDVIDGGRADASLYTRVVDGEVLAAIRFRIGYGYHLYGEEIGHPEALAEPTVIELKGAGVEWGPLEFPEPHQFDQLGLLAKDGSPLWAYGYEDEFTVLARGTLAPGATGEGIWGTVVGQTCDDNGCIPYSETFVSQGEGEDAWFANVAARAADPSHDATEGSGAGDHGTELAAATGDPAPSGGGGAEEPLGAFLLLCVGGGLFTLLMPCTYPMIPITISFFTKQAESRGGKVLPLSLAYGTGIVLIFALIGALIGPPIVAFAQHWVTNLIIGLAFLYFALVLFGVINLQPPRWMMNLAGSAQGKGGLGGVFLMGMTLVITSFTCTAPIVGGILGLGADGGNLGRIVLGMSVFGLTMAIPFVILSLLPGRMAAIPKAGQWMNTLKFYLGFVEVAAAMKFFSNVDVALNKGAKWLQYGPFLWAWVAIFVLAGLYLLGFVRFKDPKGPIGPIRMAGGILTLAFASYLGFAANKGVATDSIMAALAPPVHVDTSWPVVVDDYDGARELALAEDKLLFVNFTGHT